MERFEETTLRSVPTEQMAMTARQMDIEANAFAMELLMPFDWIVRDAANLDLDDEKAVLRLAKKYKVAPFTMAFRLGEVREMLS